MELNHGIGVNDRQLAEAETYLNQKISALMQQMSEAHEKIPDQGGDGKEC